MSANKEIGTKVAIDENTDSGFISGPIDHDNLDSGDLSAVSELDVNSETVQRVLSEENPDSGLVLCSDSLSNLHLDEVKTPTPTQSTQLRSTQTKTQDLPPLHVLFQQDEDGDTQLHIAAVHGSEESVGILIKLCPEKLLLDVANDYRHTALHLAVMSNNSVITRMLVLAGASLAVRDVSGRTPVHIAAENCHVECLKALLAPVKEQPHRKLSAVLNQKDYNGQTCVHAAATAGHIKTLQTLVYYGADINAKDGLAGWTALHIAARRGDSRLAQYLLDQCPGVVKNARDFGGRTPRRLAKKTKAERVFVKLQTDSDSDTDDDDDYDSEGETLFEKLLSRPNPINVA